MGKLDIRATDALVERNSATDGEVEGSRLLSCPTFSCLTHAL